ncbi:MAG: hypothetical protein IKE46_08660 [Selenomonadaceae bacterium]|nr:hypothetical protein [Selenomonadaceae bacterium]MBR3747083.1 hypothetical protein [Selenomonadaceae bacterium]
MPNRFLIIVTIVTVLLTIGVITFAFKDVAGGGQHSDNLISTVSQYWRKAKKTTLEYAAPVLGTFGVNVDEGRISTEDSDVSKYLEDAASSLNSTIKSITK